MATVQVVPETASQPLQPVKREPKAGVAVRVTVVPLIKFAEQLELATPQSIPVGLEGTLPPPMMPVLVTVRVKRCRAEVAVTDVAALMVTVQGVPETASQPLQPINTHRRAVLAGRSHRRCPAALRRCWNNCWPSLGRAAHRH